jgi:hypothetical protein
MMDGGIGYMSRGRLSMEWERGAKAAVGIGGVK